MKNIFEYTDFRKFLADYFRERKKAQPGFSHRVIGSRVGFSPGYFSRILAGTKPLSEKLILNFCSFLKLSLKESAYFEAMVRYNQARSLEESRVFFERMIQKIPQKSLHLSPDQLAILAEWHHAVIHAIVHLRRVHVDEDLKKIGDLLIPPVGAKTVLESLRLLERLGVVGRGADGVFHVKEPFLASIKGADNRMVVSYLVNSLSRAAQAIRSFPTEERPTSTMVISASPKALQKIKTRLDDLRADINRIVAEDAGCDRVFQFNYQFFPVSRPIPPEEP